MISKINSRREFMSEEIEKIYEEEKKSSSTIKSKIDYQLLDIKRLSNESAKILSENDIDVLNQKHERTKLIH